MPKVKMYTTQTCVFCKAEKKFLEDNKIDFEEVSVDEDPKAQQEMYVLSGGQLGVPFTVITREDGKLVGILGFDQAQLKSELGIK